MHIPVLLNEIISEMKNMSTPPTTILDGTFGRGGHTRAFLEAFPDSKVVAVDRDNTAIDFAKEHFSEWIQREKLVLVKATFSDYVQSVPKETFDAILFDLGVSSPQLDEAERGFSFNKPGRLDMRMDTSTNLTAYDIVNTWEQEDLANMFYKNAEARGSRRVAKAIVEARQVCAIETTEMLAKVIARAAGWRQRGHHPATIYFLALRMEVNSELDQVREAIPHAISSLKSEGLLIIITFHSSEDRLVKYKLKEFVPSHGRLINKKVIIASKEETNSNPRSRSAKLRMFQKGVAL